jgi:hypothetical protein
MLLHQSVIFSDENALKLAYDHLLIRKNFRLATPRHKGREKPEGREREGDVGRGGDGRRGGERKEGKGREGKGREGKGREGKGREGKGREGIIPTWTPYPKTAAYGPVSNLIL